MIKLDNVKPRKLKIQTLMVECPQCGCNWIWIAQDMKRKEYKCECGFLGEPDDFPWDEDESYVITFTEDGATVEECGD